MRKSTVLIFLFLLQFSFPLCGFSQSPDAQQEDEMDSTWTAKDQPAAVTDQQDSTDKNILSRILH